MTDPEYMRDYTRDELWLTRAGWGRWVQGHAYGTGDPALIRVTARWKHHRLLDGSGITLEAALSLQRTWDALASQLSFDDLTSDRPGKARSSGQSATSRIAALAVTPRTGTQRARVLDAIRTLQPIIDGAATYGLTDEEIEQRTGIPANSSRARRTELVDGGWLCDTGIRRTTVSGAPAVVWGLTPKGRQL